MDINYAKFLLGKSRGDYNSIANDFSRTRAYLPDDLKILGQYAKEGEKVLDLGCGNGRLVKAFEDKNIEYAGADNSEKLLAAARSSFPQSKFVLASGLSLPFPDNSFDKIFCLAVFHHIPSDELRIQFLKEAKRVLKANGLLILTVWDLWHKEKIWFLFMKYFLLKIIGLSKLDIGDIFYPWKNQEGKIIAQRYFRLFSKKQLRDIISEAGFEINKIEIQKRSDKENNILVIASNLTK